MPIVPDRAIQVLQAVTVRWLTTFGLSPDRPS